MTAAAAPTRKLAGLQLGRAIAAVSVVVGHAIAHPYPSAPGITHLLGRYGVTIFFVISGYIMVHTTGLATFEPKRFITRRLVRVVPLYYVATLFLAVCTLVLPSAFKRTVFDVPHLLTSLLFIPSYTPDGTHQIAPFFKLGWTLNYEMFFYAVFAALFFLTALRRALAISLVFVGLILLGQAVQFSAAIPKFYTELSLLGFVAGVWVGLAAIGRGFAVPVVVRRMVAVASLVSLGILVARYGELRDAPWTQVWIAATAAVQVALLASTRRAVPRFLVVAGDASYAMYLFHMFAIGIATAVERRLPDSMIFVMMGVAAVAGIASGIVVHYLVELPLNRWVRARFEPRSPIAIPSVAEAGGSAPGARSARLPWSRRRPG